MLSDYSETDEVNDTKCKKPHVVILGAGASCAAFPNGDKNGERLPVLKDFVETIGLHDLMNKAEVDQPYEDFEAIYSRLSQDGSQSAICEEIEERVRTYFRKLELPDMPTLYDHLVLSLRPKDVIATFNWDPFLWDACQRSCHFSDMPMILFLHGSVAIGQCGQCKTVCSRSSACAKCGEDLLDVPLLYPVTKKDYQCDPAIANHWKRLEWALTNAWAFTIFGYSAPKTDIEAIEIMKHGWGDAEERHLEEVEIIDIREENELTDTWDEFIHTHHYSVVDNFYDSIIAGHPRRSGEALYARLIEAKFTQRCEIPRDCTFEELYAWLAPRVNAE